MNILARLFGARPLPGRASRQDGFLDVDLPLVSVADSGAGTQVQACGQIEGAVLSLAVQLASKWEPHQLEGSEAFVYWGTGSLTSQGKGSDELVALLARNYGHDSLAARRMLPSVPFQVVCLEGDPRPQPTSNVRMKLFFFPDVASRYAEVFLNINNETGVLELHEKDNEYRLALLRALTEA